GDIKIAIQEWDGVFIHDAKLDYPTTKIDLPFSSRGRRSKRRRIMRGVDTYVEIDSNLEEPESPILWLVVDPDLHFCLDIDLKQAIHQWRWMLLYEQSAIHQAYIFSKISFISDYSMFKPLFYFVQNTDAYYKLKMIAVSEMCKVILPIRV
ncbi:MAG: Transcription initiation factor TFIID subunit 2, partial [Paramarteilia canceri]